jgi:hypothetical protein
VINTSYQAYLAPAAAFDPALLAMARDRAANQPATHLLVERSRGLAWLEILPWDTAVLGVESARVHALFSAAPAWTTAEARALLAATAAACTDRGSIS